MGAVKDEVGLVLNDPLHGFSFFKFHGLRHGGGEVDVPLFTFFTVDELHFGREPHGFSSFIVI